MCERSEASPGTQPTTDNGSRAQDLAVGWLPTQTTPEVYDRRGRSGGRPRSWTGGAINASDACLPSETMSQHSGDEGEPPSRQERSPRRRMGGMYGWFPASMGPQLHTHDISSSIVDYHKAPSCTQHRTSIQSHSHQPPATYTGGAMTMPVGMPHATRHLPIPVVTMTMASWIGLRELYSNGRTTALHNGSSTDKWTRQD